MVNVETFSVWKFKFAGVQAKLLQDGSVDVGHVVAIFDGMETKVEWMSNLGNQWHGFLGWVLFALIAGHILMAFVHTHGLKQPLIARMTKGDERL